MPAHPSGRRNSIGAALALCLVIAAFAAPAAATAPSAGPYVSGPVEPSVFEGDLAELPADRGPQDAPSEGVIPGQPSEPGAGDFDAGNRTAGAPGDEANADASAPLASFDGIKMTAGAPPDPTGEIGPNHFVDAINVRFQIFDRAGTPLTAALNINTLWATAPPASLCRNNNDGDPIVMYDQLNDRWIIAQFAVPVGPDAMCIAVSQTSDPVSGGWFAYEYPMVQFPDYEKFGLWRDGLYMSTFEGVNLGAFVFEYEQMLAGSPGAFAKFTSPSSTQVRGSRLLPADIDGTELSPVGAGNLFFQTIDGDLTPTPGDVDRIEVFEFKRGSPLNTSTFTPLINLPTAPFDNSMCYDTTAFPHRDCIPQLGGAPLDPLSHRPMWRASYRNFGTHESVVFNQTVDVGANTAGVRWYELRKTGAGPWTVFDQGTFAPDSTHRWMASAALNRLGEIGLGYTVSSSTIFPGLRYTGRTPTDPPGQMAPEQVLRTGAEPDVSGTNRWGDYSHMSVDPLDDCTMWYVGEYGDRRSGIGAFQVSDCIPDTTINGGPTGPTNDTTPTFELAGDEPGVTFECSVDGSAFAACPASFTPTLPEGAHAIAARAIGVKGAIDPSPATRDVTVDTTGPKAKIKRKAKLSGSTVKVTLVCKEPKGQRCKGKLKLKKGKKKKSFSVASGKKGKIKVKTKGGVSVGQQLKAKATLTDAAGNRAKVKKKVKLK